MRRVTIAIASAGRASLLRTLDSLGRLEHAEPTSVDVVVADDDPGGAAGAMLAGRTWPMPVRVVKVGARNISHARNACLEAATGEWLAFVDDDEWVAEDWLERSFAALREYEAGCVFGPVFPQYPEGTPDWLVRANPLYVDWGARGRLVETGRTGNVLMRREAVERAGLRFDPQLGASGGEDTEFFRALGRSGVRMVVTDDAQIWEEAPADRLRPAYLRRRSLRKGQSYARFRLRDIGGAHLGKALFFADALAKTAIAAAGAAAIRPFDRARSLQWALKGWMNAGKLRELPGWPLPRMY